MIDCLWPENKCTCFADVNNELLAILFQSCPSQAELRLKYRGQYKKNQLGHCRLSTDAMELSVSKYQLNGNLLPFENIGRSEQRPFPSSYGGPQCIFYYSSESPERPSLIPDTFSGIQLNFDSQQIKIGILARRHCHQPKARIVGYKWGGVARFIQSNNIYQRIMSTHQVGGRAEESSFTDEINYEYEKEKPSEEVEQENQQNFQLREPRSSTKKLRKLRTRKVMDQRSGHWTAEQNRKYYQFLQGHHMNFEKKNLRRSEKIFKVMSRFLGTRTADQCRSHHQKMQKKCLTFEKILQFLSENITDVNTTPNGSKPPSTAVKRECIQRVIRTETLVSGSQPAKQLETAQITYLETQEELVMPIILEPCYETAKKHQLLIRILHFNKTQRTSV